VSPHQTIGIGAASGALSVVLGAFGAHALGDRLAPEQLAWWETAVNYQALHAVALILFGLFAERHTCHGLASACFVAGAAIFSGTLYAMALGGPRWLGAITPIGGTLLIAGWLAFAWAAARGRHNIDPDQRR
jgi:uncharacterized membrane protein YgdD (TMEM256/DUF423 family)